MPFPVDKLVSMFNHMNTPKENIMHFIPNIRVVQKLQFLNNFH